MLLSDYHAITNAYIAKSVAYKEQSAKLEGQIEKAKNKLDGLRLNRPNWIKELIEPLAVTLAKALGSYQHTVLGPFGIGASVSIHFWPEGITEEDAYLANETDFPVMKSITFRPKDLAKGKLSVMDYSVNTGRFAEGTIGEVNGLNNPTIDLDKSTTISDILQYVK